MAATAPSASSVLQVRTPDQIKADVTNQVNQETADQTAPLNTRIGTLQGDQKAASTAIDNLFGNLQPFVNKQADTLAAEYQGAQQSEQSIYSAANQQLTKLKGDRAQAAQALAQQMGGPVAVGEFTDAVDPAAMEYANLGAGQQLHTLAYGAADVGQARAFAGRVFPLVQTEEQAQARQHYEDQIKEIQGQIDQLNAGKSSKINSGINDAMLAERNFALQQAQQNLDKVKAGHDWQATLKSMKNDDARLAIAQKQLGLQTKTTNATLTMDQKKLQIQQKQWEQQFGLSKQQVQQRQQQITANTKIAKQRIALSNKQYAATVLDAAVNPKPGKTITYSQAVPVPRGAAATGTVKDAYTDPKSPTGFSRLVTVHQASVTTPITDPNQLVDYLVAHSIKKANAINMVKSRLGLRTDWQYGQPAVAPKHKKSKAGEPGSGGKGGASGPGSG